MAAEVALVDLVGPLVGLVAAEGASVDLAGDLVDLVGALAED